MIGKLLISWTMKDWLHSRVSHQDFVLLNNGTNTFSAEILRGRALWANLWDLHFYSLFIILCVSNDALLSVVFLCQASSCLQEDLKTQWDLNSSFRNLKKIWYVQGYFKLFKDVLFYHYYLFFKHSFEAFCADICGNQGWRETSPGLLCSSLRSSRQRRASTREANYQTEICVLQTNERELYSKNKTKKIEKP